MALYFLVSIHSKNKKTFLVLLRYRLTHVRWVYWVLISILNYRWATSAQATIDGRSGPGLGKYGACVSIDLPHFKYLVGQASSG